MPQQVGGLTLPVPEPLNLGDPVDPILGVLGKALQPILQKYLGDAFNSTNTLGFSVVSKVYYFDPKVVYNGAGSKVPDDGDLPGLFLFSRRIGSPRITDAQLEIEREICIFWCPPSSQTQDNSAIDGLFEPFAAVIGTVVRAERDPAWISDDDKGTDADTVIARRKIAAQTYGSSIVDWCGFSRWTQPQKDAVVRDHFTVVGPGIGSIRYDGFLARVTAYELTTRDPVAAGLTPTQLTQTTTTPPTTPTSGDPFVTAGFNRNAT